MFLSGLLGQNIQLDVGRCSDLCEENPPIRSTYVSVLNRIRNAKKVRSCSLFAHVCTAYCDHALLVYKRCKQDFLINDVFFLRRKSILWFVYFYFSGCCCYQEHEDNVRCNGTRKKWRSTCEPSLTHVETIAFNNWPKFYDVIDECSCQKSRRRCEKVPKIKKFFVGTKYEFTIDVGACAGGCRAGKGKSK